jgi:hypothetical protein
MTAATPAAGDSRKSRLPARRPALPGCGMPCEPACNSCQMSPSRPMLSTTWSWPSARPPTTPSCMGPALQPVKVTIGVQGGWIEATIRDQGCPIPHCFSDEPSRAWAVADRAVGRRVAPCQSPPREIGDPPPAHRRPAATGQLPRWPGGRQPPTAVAPAQSNWHAPPSSGWAACSDGRLWQAVAVAVIVRPAEVQRLPRNPQVELVPCRRRQIWVGVGRYLQDEGGGTRT